MQLSIMQRPMWEKGEIIFLYFFGHYTQREIGEMCGRCRSTTGCQISQYEQREEMRDYLVTANVLGT